MIKKLMNILMLSCRKATELIEKRIYFKLSKKEEIQLKIHTSVCKACSAYEKQSIELNNILTKGPGEIKIPQVEDIHPDFKDNLKIIFKNKEDL